ncbi:hypothetical protein AB870_03680 [Pandoraea faecigallinarum]|uniref:Uncharacterized protein n=1 Tax=Pandoraea faecigallinarum TaxID=656179 RepID=A0A0H3WN98_9BURK|nr:hypothetical protein AB870_03680 [Pandoraea faecigallinarum]
MGQIVDAVLKAFDKLSKANIATFGVFIASVAALNLPRIAQLFGSDVGAGVPVEWRWIAWLVAVFSVTVLVCDIAARGWRLGATAAAKTIHSIKWSPRFTPLTGSEEWIFESWTPSLPPMTIGRIEEVVGPFIKSVDLHKTMETLIERGYFSRSTAGYISLTKAGLDELYRRKLTSKKESP